VKVLLFKFHALALFNFVQVFEALHGKMGDVDGLMLMPVVLHPYSRGSVRLASTKPSAKPLVDPNFLNDTRDADALLEGIV
jgi:choline dehydrogenase-like flavoprotein